MCLSKVMKQVVINGFLLEMEDVQRFFAQVNTHHIYCAQAFMMVATQKDVLVKRIASDQPFCL